MTTSDLLFIACVASFTTVAAVWDWRTKRLPNRLTVPACGIAFAFHAIVGGWQGVALATAGFAVGFGVLLILWLIGGGGAGDVKMMGALGAWLGPERTIAVFLISVVLVVAVMSISMLFRFFTRGAIDFRRRYLQRPTAAAANGRSASSRRLDRQGWPYAVPVAVGTWMILTWGFLH